MEEKALTGLDRIAGWDEDTPQEVYVAAFSGGRSSGMMAMELFEAELERARTNPDGEKRLHEVIFANTGMESSETMEFVRFCHRRLCERLVVVEYSTAPILHKHGKPLPYEGFRVVENLDNMSTDAEPFKALVEKRQYLPNKQFRLCTEYLKIRPIMQYIYLKYGKNARVHQYLGIRADERRRAARIRLKNDAYEERVNSGKNPLKWTNYVHMPLVEEAVDKSYVLRWWKQYKDFFEFDITNPSVRLSNCVGCFFNGDKDIIAHAAMYPEYADKWIKIEKMYKRDKQVENTLRDRFAETYLGRKATQEEKFTQSPLKHATWSMVKEAAGNLKGQKFKFAQQEIEWQGCGDGFCGTDI